ncbi:MAG: hypothetical protein KGN36_10730 [Acidobacteriota bacterium]|nr:hypothetical protein [Acidobacteriota bacterium]
MPQRLRIVLPLAVLAALVPLYWLALIQPAVGMMHDDGIYAAAAKSLAEGHGFRIDSLPGTPAQTKYGTLYPLLLAAGWRLFPHFPQNALLLKLITVAFVPVWLWFCYQFLTRHLAIPGAAALWICAFTAGLPWCVFSGSALMSEMPFCAFSAGALWLAAEIEGKAEVTPKRAAACAILASAAYLTRSIALAVVLAGALAFLRPRRKIKGLAFYLAICGACAAGWLLWQLGHRDGYVLPQLRYYTEDCFRDWSALASHDPPGRLVALAVLNLRNVLTYPTGMVAVFTRTPVLLAIAKFALWAAVLMGVRPVLKIWSFSGFVVLYFGAMLVWRWYPDRFLLPLYPYLFAFAYLGIPARLRPSVCGLCLVGLVVNGLWFADATVRAEFPNAMAGRRSWGRQAALDDWIRRNAEPGAVVAGDLDGAIYLFTGHRAVMPWVINPEPLYGIALPVSEQIRDFESVLRQCRVRYWIDSDNNPVSNPRSEDLVRAATLDGTISLVAAPAPGVRVFAVR